MINIIKEKRGEALWVRLVGAIEEAVDFEKLIGSLPKELIVNCKGITRINSIGVKSWIRYFQYVTENGVSLQFEECTVPIVEQMNLISNFHCGGKVLSIFVPFICSGCKTELMGLFRTKDLQHAQFKIPQVKCPKCGGEAVFDDVAEEYFNFLMEENNSE